MVPAEADIVVNATSVGLHPDVDASVMRRTLEVLFST